MRYPSIYPSIYLSLRLQLVQHALGLAGLGTLDVRAGPLVDPVVAAQWYCSARFSVYLLIYLPIYPSIS